MTTDTVLRGAIRAAAAAGDAAVVHATMAVAARVAADFPELAIQSDAGVVRLRAHGLVARAFGGRNHAADPRLAGLLTTGGER